MSGLAIARALELRGLSPANKFVLVLLGDSANHEGECLIKKRDLCELAALTERELADALAELEDLGLIAPWGALDDEAIALTWARYRLALHGGLRAERGKS